MKTIYKTNIEKFITKYIDNTINDDCILINDKLYIHDTYFLKLEKIFNYSKEEFEELISEKLNRKFYYYKDMVLNEIELDIESELKNQNFDKYNLSKIVDGIKRNFIITQQYEKAAKFRDIQKKYNLDFHN